MHPGLQRLLVVDEIRDQIARLVASAATLCRLRRLSRKTAQQVDLTLTSVCNARRLLSRFFENYDDACDMLRACSALMSGTCVRHFMHRFDNASLDCDILVAPDSAAALVQRLLQLGYSLAASNDDLDQARRLFLGIASTSHLLLGGPRGSSSITIVVATHSAMQLLIQSPMLRNMQAFNGAGFVDLYPALGPDGPQSSIGQSTVHELSRDDRALFVPASPSAADTGNLANSVTIVQRAITDCLCFSLPPDAPFLTEGVHNWEVRLPVSRNSTCTLVIDADVLRGQPLLGVHVVTPRFADNVRTAFTRIRRQIMLGEIDEPSSWDDELLAMLAAFRNTEAYATVQNLVW
ncbi:hypothetical protein AURDEDRAFT_173805 [Auricularia subglabra TFB-10046 SS5]|nr:hypothetical protein AURDEDRAFT_173805 [Auricularia subglabra TFB-10046 SS5]